MIDKGNTLTHSRTRVRSSVIVETYAPANNDGFNVGFSTAEAYEPFKASGSLQSGQSKQPQEAVRYSSLGPNIYAKIRTMFDTLTFTYTDLYGALATSREIITQTSTALFSTTRLPASITVEEPNSPSFGTSVQLSPSRLAEIKQSFLDGATEITNIEPTTVLDGGILATKPGSSLIWDKPYLSSLKDSYQSSINAASTESLQSDGLRPTDIPVTDLDLPGSGSPILRPPGTNTFS